MTITQTERDEIRRRLPRGSMSRIAKACGHSRMAVTLWFHGGESPMVALAVIEELERVTKQQNEIQSRLQAILQK